MSHSWVLYTSPLDYLSLLASFNYSPLCKAEITICISLDTHPFGTLWDVTLAHTSHFDKITRLSQGDLQYQVFEPNKVSDFAADGRNRQLEVVLATPLITSVRALIPMKWMLLVIILEVNLLISSVWCYSYACYEVLRTFSNLNA